MAQSALPDAQVVAVNNQKQLDAVVHGKSLLLINRVLDGRFDAGSSLAMIQKIAAQDDAPAIMLISNFPESQAEAVEAGALPGFGKKDVGGAEATQRLRDFKL